MVVLHMLLQHKPDIPVIFLETGYHFAETIAYRDEMTKAWNLNLINAMPKTTLAEHEAQHGLLYIVQPTECCAIRKVEPLMRSIEPFQLWFTGLRREQSPTRAKLKKIEEHLTPAGKHLKKISILADWTGRRWNPTPPSIIFLRSRSMPGATPASAASPAPRYRPTRTIPAPAAGEAISWSAASIPSRKKPIRRVKLPKHQKG